LGTIWCQPCRGPEFQVEQRSHIACTAWCYCLDGILQVPGKLEGWCTYSGKICDKLNVKRTTGSTIC
ncbi:MAG: hypothetical protein ACKPKO_37375, partial [Candidatus Fonsibacter sp.]